MNPEKLRKMIITSQRPNGAFPSIAQLPGGSVPDENGFVTALVVHQLCHAKSDPEIAAACQRGLDFLLQCEQPKRPGAFSFYPPDGHPAWMGELLPADADDTALCSLALLYAGYWEPKHLGDSFFNVVNRYCIKENSHQAQWHRPQVFPTWLDSRRLYNPIDVCVNINVAVMIQESGIGSRYSQSIMEMVDAAIDWIGDDREKIRFIMPYYPHPGELDHALQRAVSAGVYKAEGLLKRFRDQPWSQCEDSWTTPVCCSLGGGIIWTSPILQLSRYWAQMK